MLPLPEGSLVPKISTSRFPVEFRVDRNRERPVKHVTATGFPDLRDSETFLSWYFGPGFLGIKPEGSAAVPQPRSD